MPRIDKLNAIIYNKNGTIILDNGFGYEVSSEVTNEWDAELLRHWLT